MIKDGEIKHIVFACGAGISTSAGIPDFRDPEKGIYSSIILSGYDNPEDALTLSLFRSDPKILYSLIRENLMHFINARPTLTHYFIRLMVNHKILLRCYTQNVDTLEKKAGIDEHLVIFAHGHMCEMLCLTCNQKCTPTKTHIKAILSGGLPLCQCGQTLRPNIVFFDEDMPDIYNQCIGPDTNNCDLLMVVGTSLSVPPFSDIIDRVHPNVPKLIINKTPIASVTNGNYENVVTVIGECDVELSKLAEFLGWKDELDEMMKS